MADYQEYIGALRKCAKEHENDRTSTGQIIVSNLCEVIADLLENLSSSGKSNKSIEEKCPCYYCEHFEIKGWSHCKIHEDAYGDSRCNDYHKINQEPNKSEIPTGSTTKDDLGVDCISREQAIRELKESAEHHANDSREEALLHRDRDIIRALPPVTPIQSWISISEKLPEENGGYLVTVKRGYVTTALWVGIAEYWKEVIAWMALPKPYREVEE